jgi:hypothetical protein
MCAAALQVVDDEFGLAFGEGIRCSRHHHACGDAAAVAVGEMHLLTCSPA